MKNRIVVLAMLLAAWLAFVSRPLCAQVVDVAAAQANQPNWVPDEVIVVYRTRPASADFSRLRQRLPSTRAWRSMRHPPLARNTARTQHPLSRVRIVKLAPGQDVQATAARISRMPGVAYAHPNYITHPSFSPNDPRYGTGEQYGPEIIRAPEAWDLTTGDPNVVIAIADSGLNFVHEDFFRAVHNNPGETFDEMDDDGNGFVDDVRGWDFMNNDNFPGWSSNHGTHVAGIAAARIDNGKGITGMTNCSIMPLQVFDGNLGTWEAIANAIYYAVDNGASVLNYSGGGTDIPANLSILQEAVVYAWDNDMPVVVAAGNVGDFSPFYPASYPQTIAVAATGPLDSYYGLSGKGPHIDVVAPGIGVLSTFPNNTMAYGTLTGTSMATPHVTGLVALMLSLNPSLHVEQIRQLLHDNAVDLGTVGFDQLFGYGRIDAKATLDAVPLDNDPPFIVHDGGVSTSPFSGYIDSRHESSDGVALDVGIDTFTVQFSEPVRDVGSGKRGALTVAACSLSGTSVTHPDILSVDATGNPTIRVTLSGPIPVAEWTTLAFDVEDMAGNRIVASGNLGEGADETDRIDVGFLPADIDQSEQVTPQDLVRFRAMRFGNFHNPLGQDVDYADIDRNGAIEPQDLILFRQLVFDTPPATRRWALESLPPRP